MPAKTPILATATNAQLAAHYRVSVSTIKAWLRKYGSAVVRDPAKLQIALDAQRSAPEIVKGTPLAEARRRKIELEIEALAMENEVRRDQLVATAEVDRMATAWAAQVKAEIMGIRAEGPLWSGLSPAEIEARAVAWANTALERLATFSSAAK